MLSKEVKIDKEARDKVLEGIFLVARAVSSTLGPCGRLALIDKSFGAPKVTKDGVTIAKEIGSKDKFVNLGIKLFQEASSKTDKLAGDGTTTSVVLCKAIIDSALSAVGESSQSNLRMQHVVRAIAKVTASAVEYLRSISSKVVNNEELVRIATISANNDPELGLLIAKAVGEVKSYGVVSVEATNLVETRLHITDGFKLEGGLLSQGFINSPSTSECVLNNPCVFICPSKLDGADLFLVINVMKKAKEMGKDLLIVCDDIASNNEVILCMLMNKPLVNSCIVKAPIFGYNDAEKEALLNDRAALLGCKPFVKDRVKINEFTAHSGAAGIAALNALNPYMGFCERCVVTNDSTLLIGCRGNISERVENLKQEIHNAIKIGAEENKITRMKDRYSRLNSKAVVVKVGGNSEGEVTEKKDRIVDAVNATKMALDMGFLPGGGVAFLKLRNNCFAGDKWAERIEGFKDDAYVKRALEIIHGALEMPFKTIVENCGFNGERMIHEIDRMHFFENKPNAGFNAMTLNKVNDIVNEGILDSAGVCIKALEVASSVARSCLSTNVAIVETKEEESDN